MILFPDSAATYALDQWVDQRATWYHLFQLPIELDHTTALSDFGEVVFAGYSAEDVSTWTNATLFRGVATTWGDPLLWTCLVDPVPVAVIRGYYVTDGPTGPLLWCEMAPEATTIDTAGQQVAVQPRLQWGALPS